MSTSRRPFVRDHPAGLCGACKHCRTTGNRRGSIFYLCELSKTDARFRRYPPLPRISCPGFELADPDPWADQADESQTAESPKDGSSKDGTDE